MLIKRSTMTHNDMIWICCHVNNRNWLLLLTWQHIHAGMQCSSFCVSPKVPCYMCLCTRVLYNLICRWLLLIALRTDDSFSFQLAGGTSIMQAISSCAADTREVTFPHIRGCTCLNWDPLCCDSIFAARKMAGQVCRTFSRLPLPASVCWPKWLRSSFRDLKPGQPRHWALSGGK